MRSAAVSGEVMNWKWKAVLKEVVLPPPGEGIVVEEPARLLHRLVRCLVASGRDEPDGSIGFRVIGHVSSEKFRGQSFVCLSIAKTEISIYSGGMKGSSI